MREAMITEVFHRFDLKKRFFFEVQSWLKFNNLRLVLSMALKFYRYVGKKLKFKVKSVERNQQGIFLHFSPPPILNRVERELRDSRSMKTIKKEKYRFHCFITCNMEVTCFFTAIIQENMFRNTKSAVFAYGGNKRGIVLLSLHVCRCSI